MLEGLTENVAMILALSAASERLVALVKGLSSFLDEAKPNNKESERRRKWSLRLIGLVAGIVTAALASGYIFKSGEFNWFAVVGLGILASGGSDLWNSVLGYLNGVKDAVKKKTP